MSCITQVGFIVYAILVALVDPFVSISQAIYVIIMCQHLVNAIDLKFGRQEVPVQLNGLRKLQLCISFGSKVMVLVHKTVHVWKTPFRKLGHNIITYVTMVC